ncbi:hypothetical protein DTL21_18035 [Bremerella cremea]|uniref:Uncharacterized protein n=1 Tax=Blastopirellula marina TaxID=124 RepID=A0A2S8FIW8_9BACT|nr:MULTISPECIES: hypothetical protein [Pirellulaceae]PQO32135.1 hypothetical protein C5Y83_18020 [Blastopirellula marina]RCS45201.1 hypothetical protein DTL21_18035 [Bremerella cremea]
MNDISSTSISNPTTAIKEAIQLGFYIGAGVGLAAGSAVSILLGSNLVWQSGGLLVGSVLGVLGGTAYGYLARRMKPAPAYRSAP